MSYLSLFSNRKRSWKPLLALLMLLLVCPLSALADEFVDVAKNYTVMSYGQSTVRIKMPMYNKDGRDTWVMDGHLYIREVATDKNKNPDTSQKEVVYWGIKNNTDISDGAKTVDVKFSSQVLGQVEYLGPSGNIALAPTLKYSTASFDGTDQASVEFEWTLPLAYRGKKLEFTWSVKRRRTSTPGTDEQNVSIPSTQLEIADASDLMTPIITQAILTPEEKYAGELIVPWIIAVEDNQVVEAKYTYKDGDGNIQTRALDKKASGQLRLNATDVYDSIVVLVNYKYQIKENVYDYTGFRASEPYNAPMLHKPQNLKIEPIDDQKGTVKLSWEINQNGREDFLTSDNFQIQRSLSGREEDFMDIGAEIFDNDQKEYTFEDNSLLENLKREDIDELGYIYPVYRLRRVVSTGWGWLSNNLAVNDTTKLSYTLLTVSDAKGVWEDQEMHTVKVTWDYKQKEGELYVWDTRAEMKLYVKISRSDGTVVDSLVHVLTPEEVMAKSKVITLPRSCSNYEFYIITSDKTSPVSINKTYKRMEIASVEDWLKLGALVEQDIPIYAVLTNDITLEHEANRFNTNEFPGYYSEHPFSGVFDGNGHTITLQGVGFSLFPNAKDLIVRNLILGGEFSFRPKCGGIIGKGDNILFENVVTRYKYNSGTSSGVEHASFIHSGQSVRFTNCVDAAELLGRMSKYGFFFNTVAPGTPLNVVYQNCVYAPTNVFIEGIPFGGLYTDAARNVDYTKACYIATKEGDDYYDWLWKWFKQIPDSLSIEEKLAILGDKWEAAPQWPHFLPKMNASSVSSSYEVLVKTDNLYFNPNGRVAKNSLVADTRQSSVMLTWEIETGTVDYFDVMRRPKGQEKWDVVISGLQDLGYEDTSVSPVVTYEYKVLSATSCDGVEYNETNVVEGRCKDTGMLEGYVRYPDGTGVPGVIVKISYGKTDIADVTTDENGHYEADLLSYFGNPTAVYDVVPAAGAAGITLETKSFSAEFNGDVGGNYYLVPDFIVTSGYKFTGKVLYNGTTIPVPGVHFTVNGYEVRGPSGNAYETDADGKFYFYVNGGNNKIQAHLEGHKFYQGGWFKGENGRVNGYNIHGDVSSTIFYDDTKVKLIGRITGGMRQATLPLDNSLSHNNLGDTIVMVMALEGDNKSRLVYDVLDPLRETHDTIYMHKAYDTKYDYHTTVHTTRRTIKIWPDPRTGEYTVMLPPTKWKIQQVYATGYATLFHEGEASDVIDLTDSLTLHKMVCEGNWVTYDGKDVTDPLVEYNAIYNRIWHAPVELRYEQLGFDNFGYFGDLNYNAANIDGSKATVPLAYEIALDNKPLKESKHKEVCYTFGHPVFSVERQYPFKLRAVERYFWNNNSQSDTVDVVKMQGGMVKIHNGMVSSSHSEEVELDDNGEALVAIKAAQLPYLLNGDDALRTVTMTLSLDGSSYEADPLDAYVLNIYEKPGAQDILSVDQPILVDILRDPPGGGSSAKLSKGTQLKYSYSVGMEWKLGTGISLKSGSSLANFTGAVAAPMGAGVVGGVNNSAENSWETSLDLIANGNGKRAFSYSISASSDISTSSDSKLVGALADVFIGIQQSIVMKPAYTIRAIPDAFFKQMGGEITSGRVLEIAKGMDSNNKLFHLVRDESVTLGPKFKSTFMHSQQYIINNILPDIMTQCKSLMFTGSKEEAEAVAVKTNKPVYLSLVPEDDDNFAIANSKDGEYYSYTNKMPDEPGMNYRIILPPDYSGGITDEVYNWNQTMVTWVKMLAQNEKEKLTATELVRNFDVDGAVGASYEEEFSSEYESGYGMHIPFYTDIHDPFFGDDGASAGSTIMGIAGEIAPMLLKYLSSLGAFEKSFGSIGKEMGAGENTFEINFFGTCIKLEFDPALEFNQTPEHSTGKSWSRKESFDISMDKKSHLSFDVYRVNTVKASQVAQDAMDVFTSESFDNLVDYNNNFLKRDFSTNDFQYARSFVYRTRAGATCRPWEDQRVTNFYKAGEVLDVRTQKIENPKIRMDKQSVSGVPYGEPARFTLYLANESEEPQSAYPNLNLYFDDTSNPNGATLKVEGYPLTWDGFSVGVEPGEVTQKSLEVYAGKGFDFENLKIGLMSPEDNTVFDEVTFDVHYLHTAGKINISTPSDKWIMNTDAAHDKNGYHIPVVIDGFDKNQPNFDHIEFQYKETARGDDFWTNKCSFYATDSLYKLASGTKEMIPANAYINTDFYGEGEEIEKAYDLRAVLFCRSGNDFITSSSKILSGIKDTRRPRLFGTPEPKDGILDVGDDIIFNFTENIEANYLDDEVNFEVKGEINNSDITNQVCLLFSGDGTAQSEASRNFSGKDITIDMLIKPEPTGKQMTLFTHGASNNRLQFVLTKENKLKAYVGKAIEVFESTQAIDVSDFRHVALVIRHPDETSTTDKCKLLFYNDEICIGEYEMKYPYTGVGKLYFGSSNEPSLSDRNYYKGRMLEARVWYRALTGAQIGTVYGNRLNGYEMGLVDYYPMNEGVGSYAADKAQGATLTFGNGVTWSQPNGMSLHLALDDKGMPLSSDYINRGSEYDYSLMFWFKTNQDGRGVLISNGSGDADENSAQNKFYIGFESHRLFFRSNGRDIEVPGYFSDDKWHHYAMTIDRPHNTGCIYVDQVLRNTFSVDTLGGIAGGHPMLGAAMKEHYIDGNVVVEDTRNWFEGNIDEIVFFEQALPLSLIKNYSVQGLSGEEAGLLFYLSFSHQERQKDYDITLVPYPWSLKVYKDHGKIVYEKDPETDKDTTRPKRDFIFAKDVTPAMVTDHIDQNMGAPVKPYQELHNLDFSFVGRDNQLYININETDEKINKRNVFVTVRNIPDLNGNEMASPVTTTFFVDRNPLRWSEKSMAVTSWTDYAREFDVTIINTGPVKHTYTVTNYPSWLTVTPFTNTINARSEEVISFKVSKDLNPGIYDEIIYLVDEDGMAEPLSLVVTVEGDEPYWSVETSMRQYTMSIVGTVYIGDEIDSDVRDIVGVFDSYGVCHGVSNIDYNNQTGEAHIYLTVFNNTKDATAFNFVLWRYSTGKMMQLITDGLQKITFENQAVLGKDTPVRFVADNRYVQTLNLKQDWNWVSVSVYNSDFATRLPELLAVYPWQEGDVITDNTNNKTMAYTGGRWVLSESIKNFNFVPQHFYCIKVKDDIVVQLMGNIIMQENERTIQLKNGWNSIGYTPMVALPVATALTDYRDKAMSGDVVKSHDEFAVLTITSNGNHIWSGNLKYMKPGEGYMLYHNSETPCSFTYPFYDPENSFVHELYKAPEFRSDKYATMSLTATTTVVELLPGDKLLAYSDAELRGVTVIEHPDSVIYMSIGGDQKASLWFAVERDDDVIATTTDIMSFDANAIIGSQEAPERIDFTHRDSARFGWYTLDGIKLDKRPVKRGVYIYNGKKYVIE
ncbi:MAG: hypothetical protein J6Z41_07285 [Prevotella sp.]|nr:hypothetical protein [Prevotella sp.]